VAAPTQVAAQRPAAANGGAPQANGKQGGKEDEEDWWTE
jgi:hypothetical protein